MIHKTWNVRDQTNETLYEMLTKKYKEIEAAYKMIRRVSNINDAKKIIDEIWLMKSFADDIEIELLRREYNNGETQ